MARIISVHEYDLKPGSNPAQLEQALRDGEARGLFDLPGLMTHHFIKGREGRTAGRLRRYVDSMKAARPGSGCGALWSARWSVRSIRRNGGFGRRSCWPPS